jgi:hypothetical protein
MTVDKPAEKNPGIPGAGGDQGCPHKAFFPRSFQYSPAPVTDREKLEYTLVSQLVASPSSGRFVNHNQEVIKIIPHGTEQD